MNDILLADLRNFSSNFSRNYNYKAQFDEKISMHSRVMVKILFLEHLPPTQIFYSRMHEYFLRHGNELPSLIRDFFSFSGWSSIIVVDPSIQNFAMSLPVLYTSRMLPVANKHQSIY